MIGIMTKGYTLKKISRSFYNAGQCNMSELQERVVIPYTFNLKNLGKKSRGRHYGI
jgi:hypothetical protein